MKHISAVLGSPKKYYIEKFAWIPKRLRCGSYVWLTGYIVCERSWRWSEKTPIVSKVNMSLKDAVIERIKGT